MKKLVTKILNGIDSNMTCDNNMLWLRTWVYGCPILGLDGHESEQFWCLRRHVNQCDEKHDKCNDRALICSNRNLTITNCTESDNDKVKRFVKIERRIVLNICHGPFIAAIIFQIIRINVLTVFDFGKYASRNYDDCEDCQDGPVYRLIYFILS
jgi:hypothetical protein